MQEQRGMDRVVFFSDAVMAIAMTLLVLPLIEFERDAGGSVADLLSDERDKLITFAISFAVIARYWGAHHRLFRGIVGFNDRLVWVNFVFLFSIVFLPFPTELIGSASGDATAAGLYIATLMVSTGSLMLIRLIVSRNPELQHPEEHSPADHAGLYATLGALVIAFVIALAAPKIGLAGLLLLIPASWIHGPRPKPAASREA